MEIKINEKSLTCGNKLFALLLIGFEACIIAVHAHTSVFKVYPTSVPTANYANEFYLLIFTSILALLGYGIVIAHSNHSIIPGLMTTMIATALTVQIAPLLLHFWNNVYNSFSGTAQVSFSTQRTSMILCCSLLIAFTSLVGRLGKPDTFLAIILYNVGWTFNLKTCFYMQQSKSPIADQSLFDDYGSNYIYVFAGAFSLICSLLINCKAGKDPLPESRSATMISLIGTGFVFACFPFTGIIYTPDSTTTILKNTEGPLNIYFALTASVICVYITSTAFSQWKTGFKESIVGVLSGGVALASVAGTINNIGACIAIGAVAGILSGLWLRYVREKTFFSRIDKLGIIGPIFISSILGGFVISPLMYLAYKTKQMHPLTLSRPITNNNLIYYQLIYFGISLGSGILTGAITGILCMFLRKPENDFNLSKMMSKNYGLYPRYQAPAKGLPNENRMTDSQKSQQNE